MIRAVLDTNVLASGAVSSSGTLREILAAWADEQFELVISDPLMVELRRTLQKPYFQARSDERRIRAFLTILEQDATRTPITAQVSGVATHPEDDLILATAVSSQSDCLVTGDRKLQQLGTYQRVKILSPRAFLEVLLAQTPTR